MILVSVSKNDENVVALFGLKVKSFQCIFLKKIREKHGSQGKVSENHANLG